MPGTYAETLREGAANQVPIIACNIKDECGATYGLNISLATYRADLNATYSGQWVDRFYSAYPADNSTAGGAYNSQFTDRSKVGTYFWTEKWYQASKQPIWTYIWDHAPPSQNQGAYHESEINYVLNNLYDTTDKAWTAEDFAIARTMNQYWVNFIKYGNPNGQGLVEWPVTGSEATVQRLGNAFEQVKVASEEKVELFRAWFATLVAYRVAWDWVEGF